MVGQHCSNAAWWMPGSSRGDGQEQELRGGVEVEVTLEEKSEDEAGRQVVRDQHTTCCMCIQETLGLNVEKMREGVRRWWSCRSRGDAHEALARKQNQMTGT